MLCSKEPLHMSQYDSNDDRINKALRMKTETCFPSLDNVVNNGIGDDLASLSNVGL